MRLHIVPPHIYWYLTAWTCFLLSRKPNATTWGTHGYLFRSLHSTTDMRNRAKNTLGYRHRLVCCRFQRWLSNFQIDLQCRLLRSTTLFLPKTKKFSLLRCPGLDADRFHPSSCISDSIIYPIFFVSHSKRFLLAFLLLSEPEHWRSNHREIIMVCRRATLLASWRYPHRLCVSTFFLGKSFIALVQNNLMYKPSFLFSFYICCFSCLFLLAVVGLTTWWCVVVAYPSIASRNLLGRILPIFLSALRKAIRPLSSRFRFFSFLFVMLNGSFCFFFIINSKVNTWLSRLNKAYSQGVVVLLDPSIVFCCPFFYSARCILGCFIFLCLPCMYIGNLRLGSVTPRAQLIGIFSEGFGKKGVWWSAFWKRKRWPSKGKETLEEN
jgi:hypothetical protein